MCFKVGSGVSGASGSGVPSPSGQGSEPGEVGGAGDSGAAVVRESLEECELESVSESDSELLESDSERVGSAGPVWNKGPAAASICQESLPVALPFP